MVAETFLKGHVNSNTGSGYRAGVTRIRPCSVSHLRPAAILPRLLPPQAGVGHREGRLVEERGKLAGVRGSRTLPARRGRTATILKTARTTGPHPLPQGV